MIPFELNVTIVSEDSQLLQELCWTLTEAGYSVQTTRRFAPLAATWRAAAPEFLLVDAKHSDLASASQLPHQGVEGFTYKILLLDDGHDLDRIAELELSFNDAVAKPVKTAELLARLSAGQKFLEFERSISQESLCDPCTGLLSKTGLLQTLDLAGENAASGKSSQFGMALISLDLLDNYAARLGREAQNQLLCDAADMLESSVGEEAWLARVGPNALAIAYAECSVDQIEKVAEEVRHKTSTREFKVGGETLNLTATLCAKCWDDSTSPEDALADAQRNLKLAQSLGGSTLSWCGQFDEARQAWESQQTRGDAASAATARDVMTPFAAAIRADQWQGEQQRAIRTSDVPLAPYFDEQGNYVGIVRRQAWQEGCEGDLAEQIETPIEVSETMTHGDLASHFASPENQLLVVMADRQPVGYVTAEGVEDGSKVG